MRGSSRLFGWEHGLKHRAAVVPHPELAVPGLRDGLGDGQADAVPAVLSFSVSADPFRILSKLFPIRL